MSYRTPDEILAGLPVEFFAGLLDDLDDERLAGFHDWLRTERFRSGAFSEAILGAIEESFSSGLRPGEVLRAWAAGVRLGAGGQAVAALGDRLEALRALDARRPISHDAPEEEAL